jgi:hypothetical protein
MEAKEMLNSIVDKLGYYKNKANEALERGDVKECDKWLNKFDELAQIIKEAFADLK